MMFFVKHNGSEIHAVYRIRPNSKGTGRASDYWSRKGWVENDRFLAKYLAVGFDTDTDEITEDEAEKYIALWEARVASES
jgi:hypothetical protein